MPQKIIEFKSLEEATATLKDFGNKFKFPIKQLSSELIVKESVSSNVLRAFHNLSTPPSIIYREWALESFDLILSDLKLIQSSKDYYDFIFRYSDSLINRWAEVIEESNSFLMYGQATKMINLLIKDIQESETYRQVNKIKYQQVPFDSFSLLPIRSIINDLTDVNYKIIIPSSASMGFINTPQLYVIIMDAVSRLCKLSKVSPIVYDYWCWNDKHGMASHI
jgi:hypothetical protein